MIISELQFDFLPFHCLNLNIEIFVDYAKKSCTQCLCFSFLANPLSRIIFFLLEKHFLGKFMFHFVICSINFIFLLTTNLRT